VLRDDRGTAPRRQATAPAHRPTWLVLLSSLTLIYGGLLLVSGLTALRDPQAAARIPVTEPLPPAEETFSKQLTAVNITVITAHARAIRGRAAASLILALLMLYAAAATLSRDRHGRTVTLAAAWLGIAYQVASLPVVIPIARDYARVSAPLLAQMVATEQSTAAQKTTPDAIAGFVQSVLVGIPVVTAVLGVAGSALLISYFGGRRGRVLYGLEAPAPLQEKR
jgi:hypothetical protein